MSQQPKETCQRTCRGPKLIVIFTYLNTHCRKWSKVKAAKGKRSRNFWLLWIIFVRKVSMTNLNFRHHRVKILPVWPLKRHHFALNTHFELIQLSLEDFLMTTWEPGNERKMTNFRGILGRSQSYTSQVLLTFEKRCSPKPFGQTKNRLVSGRLACTSSKT